MKESISICVWGFDLDVEYYYTKGYSATLEEPGEPEGIEISEIRFVVNHRYIYNLDQTGCTEEELQESQVFLEAVEQEIWEAIEYNKQNNYDDYKDDSYFDWEPEIEW